MKMKLIAELERELRQIYQHASSYFETFQLLVLIYLLPFCSEICSLDKQLD